MFGIIMLIFRLGISFLKFTGLYLPVITCILIMVVLDKFNLKPTRGSLGDTVSMALVYISMVPVPFICIGNIIRLANPEFSFLGLISDFLSRKDTGTYENIDDSLVGLESGVILGKLGFNYIVMPEHSEGHLMVVGGQGSGKSTSVAIPTLLNYNSSILAIDIKGELSDICRSYRKNIKVFNPLDDYSPHYDPYAILKQGNKVQGAREISLSLIPISNDEKDPYWKQSAQNLLTASILHFSNENLDFPTTCKLIMNTEVSQLIGCLKNSPVSEARMFVNQFVGADNKQLASIFSTLSNEIIVFATDENIMRALSSDGSATISAFDLENLTDIFIKISEDKLDQWKQLLNLMISQFMKAFEKRTDKAEQKILFMIDEFPRLGKVNNIVSGLTTLRSKGIQIMLILQSLAQLDSIYGNDTRKVITDNCNYKIILNANDVDTQEYFSKLVGTEEREKESNSVNSNDFSVSRNKGVSRTTEEKRIIRPEEFAYLEQPVVFTPMGFFRPNKVKWYEDKIFIKRAKSGDKIA
ncbi:type IV secretory system conjugative DNA transfer family protein [Clostridium butyricum]|uniref:type IV secretory system conjugative DNA transfer family protein n=4 Tax=Clostridium butyricum TaxID=1492 RepID=UPI003467310D